MGLTIDECDKINPLSLILIYFNIPALTPGLHLAETVSKP
jgi:hypothetical protein